MAKKRGRKRKGSVEEYSRFTYMDELRNFLKANKISYRKLSMQMKYSTAHVNKVMSGLGLPSERFFQILKMELNNFIEKEFKKLEVKRHELETKRHELEGMISRVSFPKNP